MLLLLTHRSFGAVLDTCTAFYAEAVVHDRISVPVLGYGVNGAQSDERTHMIVRAGVFIYVYHCVVFCKYNVIGANRQICYSSSGVAFIKSVCCELLSNLYL